MLAELSRPTANDPANNPSYQLRLDLALRLAAHRMSSRSGQPALQQVAPAAGLSSSVHPLGQAEGAVQGVR